MVLVQAAADEVRRALPADSAWCLEKRPIVIMHRSCADSSLTASQWMVFPQTTRQDLEELKWEPLPSALA